MRQVPAWTPAVVLVLCALVLPAVLLRADGGAELQKNLLAATLRAIELESEAANQKLKAAEEGTGSKENVERFRQKIRDLEAERVRFGSLKPEEYPAPVKKPSDPASVLETSGSFGPVLPPLLREVTVKLDGPCAEGSLLHRLRLCLVYRREYFGLIGDYYVYVLSVR